MQCRLTSDFFCALKNLLRSDHRHSSGRCYCRDVLDASDTEKTQGLMLESVISCTPEGLTGKSSSKASSRMSSDSESAYNDDSTREYTGRDENKKYTGWPSPA